MRISKMQDRDCRDTLRRLCFGRLGCARDNQPYIVPVYFAYEPDHLYGFATFGQKIEWMRSNPLVCVQADEVLGQDNWVSVVVVGRYEELPDIPSTRRNGARLLLEKRAMWWQTAYVESDLRGKSEPALPVFYCVHIEEMSGLRASPAGTPVRVR